MQTPMATAAWLVAGTDELKSQAIRKITAYATRVRTQLVGDADPYKVAGWNDKHQRARRVHVATPQSHLQCVTG